ncbi:MAG: hypothetical protein ACJAZ3_000479 [Sphingobacteriales bacterium]|jgi:hypothetical protein
MILGKFDSASCFDVSSLDTMIMPTLDVIFRYFSTYQQIDV